MRLIAHRGASAHAPENTMAAFRLALSMGARALELDVHQTKDGHLAVIHDEDLKRTGGRRANVRELSWSELRRVDVGSWFDARFAAERVPELEDVLGLAGRGVEVHVEIKHGSSLYPGIEKRVVAAVARRRARKNIIVSSFDHDALERARALSAGLRVGYLLGRAPVETAYAQMRALGAESLNLGLRQVSARAVLACHRRGFKVLVYTVNDQKQLARMARLGVDGVFSNFPELSV